MSEYKEYTLPNGMGVKIDAETEKEYKKAGEYILTASDENIPKLSEDDQVFMFAVEGIKSGLDPKELSEQELTVLYQRLGEKWYEKFELLESEIRQPIFQLVKKSNKTKEEKKQVSKFKKQLVKEIKSRSTKK